MTWEKAIENYKAYLILEKSLTENSVEAYLCDINKLAKFCNAATPKISLEDVTYDVLKNYVTNLIEEGANSRTQARCISSIRSFFKYMVYEGILTENPSRMLTSPKIGRKIPNILTEKEIDAMLEAVEMFKPEGQRNRAMLEVLYSCGLRVSELVDLKLSNINFRSGYVQIEGKGNKERMIPISQRARTEIKQYIKAYRNYLRIPEEYTDILFLNRRGTPLSRVMVFNIIKQMASNANLKKDISPHTFRHTFASHLVSQGADLKAVQDMLGHESIVTTEIYTHLDGTYLRNTVNNCHPRAKKQDKN